MTIIGLNNQLPISFLVTWLLAGMAVRQRHLQLHGLQSPKDGSCVLLHTPPSCGGADQNPSSSYRQTWKFLTLLCKCSALAFDLHSYCLSEPAKNIWCFED